MVVWGSFVVGAWRLITPRKSVLFTQAGRYRSFSSKNKRQSGGRREGF